MHQALGMESGHHQDDGSCAGLAKGLDTNPIILCLSQVASLEPHRRIYRLLIMILDRKAGLDGLPRQRLVLLSLQSKVVLSSERCLDHVRRPF